MEKIIDEGKKFKQITIETKLAKELEKMNKGSYNSAIKELLNQNSEETKKWINETKNRLIEMEETLEKIVKLNNLQL